MPVKTNTPRSRTYAELIAEFPLRPLRSDRQADRATDVARRLSARAKLNRDDTDYLDVPVLADQVL